jgi:hypothetical protein
MLSLPRGKWIFLLEAELGTFTRHVAKPHVLFGTIKVLRLIAAAPPRDLWLVRPHATTDESSATSDLRVH